MAVVQPGGNGPDGNPMLRFLIPVFSAAIMSLLMIAIYTTAPHYEPRLWPEGPAKPQIQDGLWEQKDFFGLIDTQWSMRSGRADGDALQYHSNGSLFRELHYRNGRLDGPVREYYEKGPYRKPPVRGRLATLAERMSSAGGVRMLCEYRNGVPTGRYELYYPDGVLKEDGVYRNGVKQDVVRYRKNGLPRT